MEMNRRVFLKGTALGVTGVSGCLGSGESGEDLESFDLWTDLESMDEKVGGHDIHVNVYSHVESGNEGVEEVEMQYLEPGEEAWQVLDREEASGSSLSVEESYDPEITGTHSFRAVAYTENKQYVTETEDVEVF